ncbi:MAG: chemotaxis protein CheX [Candidatus Hydrogenedentes bacterium]|nr:chemotaxis protein CheX [Candidatus Hydrogenedentota bacterium]
MEMETDPKSVASEVFRDVLENLAFMFADEAQADDLPEAPAEARRADMQFTGVMAGALALAVPSEMCLEIAANMLGVDPDDDRAMEKAQDALKELLNITCGHVLTQLAGEEPVFDLSVPQVASVTAEQWDAFARDAQTSAFLIDDIEPALLKLVLDKADS